MKNTKTKKTTTKTTKKITKVIGSQTYINKETGEFENFQVIELEDKDFNFEKIWLTQMAMALDLVGNCKIHVLTYLFENKNNDNIVMANQRKMASDIGVSLPTITATLKLLKDANLISCPQQGCYRLNPNMLYKGYSKNRMNILLQFNKEISEKQFREIDNVKGIPFSEILEREGLTQEDLKDADDIEIE